MEERQMKQKPQQINPAYQGELDWLEEQKNKEKEIRADEKAKMFLAFTERLDRLRSQVFDLYHQFHKAEIWNWGNDVVADKCSEFVVKRIDELRAELKKLEGKHG